MGEEGVKKAVMEVHGNEYHDPDFEQEGVAAGLVETHRTAATHTQPQPPAEHGNEKHNPDFEQEGVAAGLVGTHEAKTTGVHGVGGSTVESAAGSQGKVDTHEAKTTGIHGVGASTVESAAGAQGKVDTHAALTSGVHGAGANTLLNSGNIGARVDVYRGSTQSIPSLVWTKAKFDIEASDVLNEWDAVTNYRFTPSVNGVYLVIGTLRYSNMLDGNDMTAALYKDGAFLNIIGEFTAPANQDCTVLFSWQLPLTTINYIEIFTFQSYVSARNIYATVSRLTITRIA
jgi:hypothetical protein